MPGWVTCPACNLKHTARPDGTCPRCKASLAPPAEPGAPASAPAIVPEGPLPGLQASPRTPPPAAPAHAAPAHPAPAPAAPAPAAPAQAALAHAAQVGAAADLVYRNEPTLFAIVLTISIMAWLALLVGTLGIALLYAPFVFLAYLFAQSALIAYLKGTAIKITPRQFPDLHARLIACGERLGIARVPDCYLLNGQGGFNAFATRFLGRNFVVLFSDVVDALEDRPGAVDFYLGHELAHIHRAHLSWRPVLMPGSLLPLLGAAYHRACESTCDRYGAACCANTQDAVAGMTALAAGEKRWKSLSVEEYVAQAQESGGFWMSFHELVSDYPWLVKRVARVIAFREGSVLGLPARHPFAYLFALFVPRMMGGGAGGVLSLLVVVAIIGIIAAIAIPSLLRARIAANEAAVTREIQTVVAAETAYGKTHGRFASIACLAAQPGCASLPANPPSLDAALASTEIRHGYRYRLDLGADGATNFAYTAVPVAAGQSGVRSFCGDSSGIVYSSVSAADLRHSERASCNPDLSPLGGP